MSTTNLKKFLALGTLAAVLPVVAQAHPQEPSVSVKGMVDVSFAYVDQKGAFRKVTPSTAVGGAEVKENGLLTDSSISVNVEGHNANMEYGGVVEFNANTSSSKTSNGLPVKQAGVYVKTPYMAAEVGSLPGVTHKMKVGGENVAVGNGGIMGDSRYLWNGATWNPAATDVTAAVDGGTATSVENTDVDTNFITSTSLPLDEENRSSESRRYGNKISLMTPNYYGVSLGLSYQSDSQLSGTSSKFTGLQKDLSAVGDFNNAAYRDVFMPALHYQNEMSGVGFKFGASGQFGSAKDFKASSVVFANSDTRITGFGGSTATNYVRERKNLQAYQFGLELNYMGVQLGGSYIDFRKSGQVTREKDDSAIHNWKGRNSYAWNVGLGYNMNDFGVSVTYMESEKAQERVSTDTTPIQRNKFTNLVFDVEYKVAPGLVPYAQVAVFDTKNRDAKKADTKAQSNDGTVFLLGTKLQF